MVLWGWTDEFRKKWKPHEDNLRHREDQPSCCYCSTLLQSPIVLLYESGDPLWWAGLPGPSVSLSLPPEHLMLMPAHPFQGPPGFTVSETPSLTYPSSQEEWDPCLSVSIMLWYSLCHCWLICQFLLSGCGLLEGRYHAVFCSQSLFSSTIANTYKMLNKY